MTELFLIDPEPSTDTQRFVRSHPRTWSQQTLCQQFPWLKSLSIDLDFLDAAGMATVAWVKFKPNPTNATLQTCFAMHGYVLTQFDFDLEQLLQHAFATDQRIIRGELTRRQANEDPQGTEAGPATIRYRVMLEF